MPLESSTGESTQWDRAETMKSNAGCRRGDWNVTTAYKRHLHISWQVVRVGYATTKSRERSRRNNTV